jgi:acyl transferase domain-containing protein/surfactin synthase thioesterase subunit
MVWGADKEIAEGIAIVGVGCRFPGGIAGPRQFWQFLLDGGNAIREVPADRWDVDALFSAVPSAAGRTYARRGGFLDAIDQFDPEFFGISPREAMHIDPQQRLLLEVAHEAMEDAGETWETPAVRNTGVFVGVFIHDYQHMQFADRERLDAHTGTGSAMSITANRVSYAFDLHGPSVAVDTACSSSLVAVDMACKALRDGSCDYALAGGVNVILKPEMTIAMSKATMLSKEGSCKSFDARADGYVRGEGAAFLLLRKVSAARRAGNRIYAVIRGSGVNSDGKTNGISVPNGDAQEALTRRVLAEAGVPASSVGYLEAHGTGTPVGDPIEAGALGRVFSEGRNGRPAWLGSVKTNIGHLESASGAAGLIKAALSVYHGQIPRNLHFQTPNPAIDFEALKLKVVGETQRWEQLPRRAAVNSFGFGGTNAHVVIEGLEGMDGSPEERIEGAHERDAPSASFPRLVLPLAARAGSALGPLARDYAAALGDDPGNAEDLVYTAARRRSHGPYRAAIVARDAADLRRQLAAFAEGEAPEVPAGKTLSEVPERPVFVFSGMGPQWWGMARTLLESEPVFRRAVGEVSALVEPLTGWSLVERLLADEESSLVQRTEVAQPAIFAVQVGLTALFAHWGVAPSAVMGHSVGEVAALHAAGVLTLEDAARVIVHRSRLQARTAGTGAMLAVGIDVARARRMLAGHEAAVDVAAVNGPRSLTLSGERSVLERIAAELEAEGTFARWLKVEVPYHSPKMDPLRADLLEALAFLRPGSGRCTYYSTADAEPAGPIGDAAYFWRNVRQSVLFSTAVGRALDDGHRVFLEVGPHPVLRASIEECLAERKVAGAVVSSLRRGAPELDSLATSLGQLFVAGAAIDWSCIAPRGRLLELPAYPWQRSRHWAESEEAEQHRKGLAGGTSLRSVGARHPVLGVRLDLPTPTWVATVKVAEPRDAYLADHQVNGAVVFPGTGYLEMALETLATDAAKGVEPGDCLLLSDVDIGRALYLKDEEQAKLQMVREGERWTLFGQTGDDPSWVQHASGRCRREAAPVAPEPLDLDACRRRCDLALPAEYGYRLFRDVGLQYGPCFRAIEELWYGPREALARLQLPAALGEGGAGEFLFFHPAMLDACLHTLFGALNLNGEDSHRRGNVFLPVSLRRLRVFGRPTATLFSHARLTSTAERHFEADISVYDDERRLVAEVVGLRCQALEHPAAVAEKRRREWLLEYEWEKAAPKREARDLGGRWLVLAPDADHPLLSGLRDRGADCDVVLPSPAPDFAALLSSAGPLRGSAAPLRGVVHAWTLNAPPVERAEDLVRDQELGAVSAIELVKALTQAGDALDAPLWIVTQSAEAVTEGDVVRPSHGPLWGLRRVIANEHGRLSARIVDVDGTGESLDALADELGHAPEEDELAFRRGARFVHRLRRHVPAEPSAVEASEARPRHELAVQKVGALESLAWVPLPDLALAPHEVEIEVAASGLNFKDVMKATGLFPARLMEGNLWSRETLGMECAGRVSRVGAAVAHVKPGDAVMALAPRSFASHVVTHGCLVAPNPGLPPAVAAGVPVAYLTVSVGLEHLARLAPGERVLIHAASGGVGQAAIQLAKSLGAEIFATAGSDEKRQLVRELGVRHVFDSRSLRFAEEIREATGGAGVDVVLNSLAGDAITHSLAVLSDYGRFVEIGKMDLDRDFPLRLRPFTRCLSFHAVDLDRMLAQKVELCGRLFRSLAERLAAGQLAPVPVTAYPAAQVSEAFYKMAGAKHTGKLVVEIGKGDVLVQPQAGVTLRRDASYLVTGGLGGFGLELARWLAARGAGRLVLLGRRGARTPGADEAAQSLRALGAEVQIEACDVADGAAVARVLERIPASAPLRGVFHAAAVLDDALLKNLDRARYETTFAAKALGAYHLHEQTRGTPLDHFMCFSSMASILGNQGSGNYCAANAYVDALAHERRRSGLPALTVNWGVIADVGMAADEDFYRQNLERNGLTTIHSAHCLELLDLLLRTGRTQTTVCPIDFETWLRFNPAGREGRLRELLAAGAGAATASRARAADEVALRAKLEPLAAAERTRTAEDAVRGLLGRVLRIDPQKIDSSATLTAMGADSLMAIEIKNRLEALGLAISVTQLLNRNSVSTLAALLLGALGLGTGAPAAPAAQGADVAKDLKPSWFLRRKPNDDARVRLFCFPYAGGGPAVYHLWPEALPDWVEVIAVTLPGRGLRAGEGNLESIARAADEIIPEILPLLDRPFALFGHCMGAILMYEVAQRLEATHGRTAAHVFASGCMAPHLYNSPLVHEQDDDTFLDVLRLISFSGTRALIEDPELRRTMFPLLRGDFRSVVQYGSSFEMRAPLRAAITGLAAENDLFAAPRAMDAWVRYSAAGYDLAQLPGDHYFVESDRPTVTRIVSGRLAQALGLPAAPVLPEIARVRWVRPDDDELGQAPAGTRAGARKTPGARSAERAQVFCFPPACLRADEIELPRGAGDLDYRAVEWRGDPRERRTVDEMVSRAYEAVRAHLDRPAIFYGHCLGAIVAYELALRLQREGRPLPRHLVVAGVVGPHMYVAPDAHRLPTEKLLELLSVLKYPLISRLQREPAFLEERIGMVRADLEAMATYQYRRRDPLAVPITAISLRHDLWSYPLRTDTWQHHTQDRCEVVTWPGDHYENLRQPERVHQLLLSL